MVDDDNDQICFYIKEFNMPQSIAGLHGSHCDGILCLPDSETNKVLLCNPALRELKLLHGSCSGSNFKAHVMVGLGYDAIVSVYKVTRVVRLHSTDDGAPIGAEICNLDGNHGESWREIKMKIEINITSCILDEAYHRGICYWVIYDKSYLKKRLISFDMHEEEFQVIPFPQDHGQHGDTRGTAIINRHLRLCDERITLFRHVGTIVPMPPNSNIIVPMKNVDIG